MAYSLRKRWRVRATGSEQAADLAKHLGLAVVVGQLLINRGICDEFAARQFLSGGLEGLHDPFLLKGMEIAVERIASALRTGEKITIYGDYDVDGITATALVYKTLCEYTANVEYYIPERQSEGYGLNVEAMAKIAASGTTLLITVDCGISAWQEVLSLEGLDIIITDHHQPPERLPDVTAVINPKQPDCPYPDKELAGVGVAFKLCQALSQGIGNGQNCLHNLDVVAIGTVADMVSLTGENRLLVKYGLQALQQTDNLGIRALCEACDLKIGEIDSGKIGYVLAPRLNASGRLNHAAAGVELLTSSNEGRVQEIALELNLTNTERQEVERSILAKAEAYLVGVDWQKTKALVVAGEDWHPGVIGIVASRLVERYHRPAVIISIRDGIGKGSCRSIPGFDIYKGLNRCADLLLKFGGHHQAAGLSLKQENIGLFTDALNAVADEVLCEDDFVPVLNIDALVSLREVNASLIEQLACLEPFGIGNPSPLLACSPVDLQSSVAFGKEKRHLRLWIRDNNQNCEVIAWNKGELASEFGGHRSAEIAFVPEVNEWQGRQSVRMRAIDVRLVAPAFPDKLAVGKLYLLLKGLSSGDTSAIPVPLDWKILSPKLDTHYQVVMDETGFTFALAVLSELGLIVVEQQGQLQQILVLPSPASKLDIASSPTFRQQQS